MTSYLNTVMELNPLERAELAETLRDYARVRTPDLDLDTTELRAELKDDPAYAYSASNTAEAVDNYLDQHQRYIEAHAHDSDVYHDLASRVERDGRLDMADPTTRNTIIEVVQHTGWEIGNDEFTAPPTGMRRVVEAAEEANRDRRAHRAPVTEAPSAPTMTYNEAVAEGTRQAAARLAELRLGQVRAGMAETEATVAARAALTRESAQAVLHVDTELRSPRFQGTAPDKAELLDLVTEFHASPWTKGAVRANVETGLHHAASAVGVAWGPEIPHHGLDPWDAARVSDAQRWVTWGNDKEQLQAWAAREPAGASPAMSLDKPATATHQTASPSLTTPGPSQPKVNPNAERSAGGRRSRNEPHHQAPSRGLER